MHISTNAAVSPLMELVDLIGGDIVLVEILLVIVNNASTDLYDLLAPVRELWRFFIRYF